MRHCRAILVLVSFLLAFAGTRAQQQPGWEIEALSPTSAVEYDFATGLARATNGVVVRYENAVLVADQATLNQETGEVVAEGRVHIQRNEQVWVGESIRYNFKTRQMQAEQFRTGKAPVFAAGQGLQGQLRQGVYTATNAFVTTDDVSEPFHRLHAKSLTIVPGQYLQARHVTLYVGGVPVMYLPYYKRTLGARANHFNVTPGYRSRFGPFLLGSYLWYWGEHWDGEFHLDYRLKRGVGGGPDLHFHGGRWGEGTARYYYLYDTDPRTDLTGEDYPHQRQRVDFSYRAEPITNLTFKTRVRYQTDAGVLREFFEGEYRENPQPGTFFELNQAWPNFSLDVLAQPRLNDFFETVERLPDVKLTAFRQQIGVSPLYYESESSVGYYRRRFPETNGPVAPYYAAARADTYHQVLLPRTLFGWLNVSPRVGGRLTYYSAARGPGAVTEEHYRGVFNTGAEISFKASRLWPGARSRLLEVDGLRHLIVPSVNYVYVPAPNVLPVELPQFDAVWPSLRLLPVEYPDYNAIDAIDSQNVLRFGLRNRLQTKRRGEIADLLDWELVTDWRLRPRAGQTTFADLYSDLVFRPRSWLTLESQTRYDLHARDWRLAFHTLTLQPNNIWSWSWGHYYVRGDPPGTLNGLGEGNNLIASTHYYRFNENWGFRTGHHFEARDGRLEEQYYTLYRDLRSWTAALTFRVRDERTGPTDYTVAFTFSLKAAPRFGLGRDMVKPYSLLGL